MSATMKPPNEFHELDVGQPIAACQVMVCPSRRKLVVRGELRPVQGGAEDTEERFLALMASSPAQGGAEDTEERVLAMLAGYMVRTRSVRPAKESGCRGSRVKRVMTRSEDRAKWRKTQ